MSSVRALFARQEDPYAGADLGLAARLSVPIWLLTAPLAVLLFPIGPPLRLGAWGWALVGVTVLVSLGVAAWVRRRGPRSGPDELLALSYAGVAQVALLAWLTGGNESPAVSLLLLWSVYTAAAHPPRRVLPFLGFVVLAAGSSLVYDGWNALAAARIGVELFLWLALSFLALVLMSNVRAQRIGMRLEEQRAQDSARTDPLTGLENRRAFDEALGAAVAAAAGGRSLSLLLADLDDFKQINDGWGHLNGDDCLKEAADVLGRALRDGDRCFRWGGDEFAILLPGMDREGAEDLAARLRRRVQASCVRPCGDPLTIETGSAELAPGMTGDELLGAADLALMGAKARAARAAEVPD